MRRSAGVHDYSLEFSVEIRADADAAADASAKAVVSAGVSGLSWGKLLFLRRGSCPAAMRSAMDAYLLP